MLVKIITRYLNNKTRSTIKLFNNQDDITNAITDILVKNKQPVLVTAINMENNTKIAVINNISNANPKHSTYSRQFIEAQRQAARVKRKQEARKVVVVRSWSDGEIAGGINCVDSTRSYLNPYRFAANNWREVDFKRIILEARDDTSVITGVAFNQREYDQRDGNGAENYKNSIKFRLTKVTKVKWSVEILYVKTNNLIQFYKYVS